MASPILPLSLLFRVLPRTAELAGLREAILTASTSNPQDEWKGSSAYSTLDRRVVTEAQLESIFDAAEERSVEHVRTYHRLLRDALRQVAARGDQDALGELQRLGEAAANEGRWETCISYYGVVAAVAGEIHATDLEILAHRHMGRAHLHLGHPARAARWYAQSLQCAESAADRQGVIRAHIGLGNAYAVEGRWTDAAAAYLRSHEECGPGDERLRAESAANLSMAARELNRFDDAHRWLDSAHEWWDEFGAAEHSMWHNNDGLLALAEGRIDDARAAFEKALADAPSHHDTALVLDNLAETSLRAGELAEAEALARAAEDYAIAGASGRALADIYIRLGRIKRAQRDVHGVSFFEKAIQLCRENGYLLSEATACAEYALFRMMLGDNDEARGLRERAELLLKRIEERSSEPDA
jgi:tetratricopeptide (TPR) repeat protein